MWKTRRDAVPQNKKVPMITNDQIIEQINKKISKKPLFYITRQTERGCGLGDLLTNYKIITATPQKDTWEILEKKRLPPGFAVVFKNNGKIQRLSKQKKLKLLNPDFRLVDKYENKISQHQWLKNIIPQNLPKTIITFPVKNSFNELKKQIGSPFICQFNRSHTGEGTMLISNLKEWLELIKKFPLREVKCASFVKSHIITVNVCVWPASSADRQDCVLIGSPSYQITGLKELTDFKFSTVGNDWSCAKKILKPNDLKTIKNLAQKIGRAMLKDGWRGLFGLDLVKDKNWLVIEVNARQPASTGLETLLQRKQGKGISIFASHLAALLGLPLLDTCLNVQKSFQKIGQGSQIVIRKKKKNNFKFRDLQKFPEIKTVKTDLKTEKHNSELFRIQNLSQGFVKNNGRLNTFGKKIVNKLK